MIMVSPAEFGGGSLSAASMSPLMRDVSHFIRICPKAGNWSGSVLVSILEELLPVKFALSNHNQPALEAEIIVDDPDKNVIGHAYPTVTSLTLPLCARVVTDEKVVEIDVNFADDPDVPLPFRGRSLRTHVAAEAKPLILVGGEKVLASSEEGPLWSVSEANGTKHFRSSLGWPCLPEDGSLISVLNGDRFLELLPIIHFVRTVCGLSRYEGPPLRACFMFDDPNLHWPRYGFVDFQQIASHAARENYHVSFATIPLDAWFTHAGTADLFRKNSDWLSLVVHGNNHTHKELAQNTEQPVRASLLLQALRRMERLEHKSGLNVSRTMVPPHGACSEAMLEELPKCGFESATISHGSLRAHNQDRPWTRNLGYHPSEMVQGCPVLPRWGLNGNVQNVILLAAYLKQPIILRGHHADLRDGLEVLDQLAQFINGLGDVLWGNMTKLSRANYEWRMDGDLLRVIPLGRRLDIRLPQQAARLVVENSRQNITPCWQISASRDSILNVNVHEPVPLPDETGKTISMLAAGKSSPLSENNSFRPPLWAFLRRLLTEGRDRMRVVS